MNSSPNGARAWITGLIAAVSIVGTGCGTKNSSSKTTDATDAETYYGLAISCTDGDTCNIRLEEDDSIMKVRLIGIDAPETSHGAGETGQPYGNESKAHINALVKGKKVRVKAISEDRYGRTLGEIYVNNLLVNVDMLKKGLAEAYIWSDDAINAERYRATEAKAYEAEIGIWSLEDYERPEDYRRRMREE